VKSLFAILTSLMLVLTLDAGDPGGSGGKPKISCQKCVCDSPCCVSQRAPVSAPAPASAPAPNSVKQVQAAVLLLVHSFLLPESAPAGFSPTQFLSVRPATIPLYERNCVYLL